MDNPLFDGGVSGIDGGASGKDGSVSGMDVSDSVDSDWLSPESGFETDSESESVGGAVSKVVSLDSGTLSTVDSSEDGTAV